MAKKIQKDYFWLTLYQPDIKNIMQLFQENLQNVEITIDALLITNSQQMEYLDQASRMKSLIVRGNEEFGQDASGTRVLHPIVLTIEERSAQLSFWNESGQKAQSVSENLNILLAKRQNFICGFLSAIAYVVATGAPLSIAYLLQSHHINFIQELFFIIVALLFVPVCILLFVAIVHFLKMDRTVFLLPGTMKASKCYRMRQVIQAIGVFIAAIVFISVIQLILSGIFRMLKLL